MVFFRDVTFLVVFFCDVTFLTVIFSCLFCDVTYFTVISRIWEFFRYFLLFVHPKKRTKETVKTNLLAKFRVTNNNSNNTLLFNLKLEFFWL